MKRITLLLFTFCFLTKTNAQMLVFDPISLFTMVGNHEAQQEQLKSIKKKEGKIAALQTTISTQTTRLRQLQEQYNNSLTQIGGIIFQAKGVMQAKRTIDYIKDYQKETWNLASGNEHLLLVAVESEAKLVKQTADLIEEIYTQAFIGGKVNMMSNADRLELIRTVNERLNAIAGHALNVLIEVRRAKRIGLLQSLGLQYFRPELNTYQHTQDAINEAKAILNR